MKKNIFGKNTFIIFGIVFLCAVIVGVSFVNSNKLANTFTESGYIHVNANENENKKILFSSGEKYSQALGQQIKFSDTNNEEVSVSTESYIHYDNALASFTDGVLVDVDELSSEATINHYSLPAGMLLKNTGSSYTAESAGEKFDFSNFIWKLSENKYLIKSNGIQATFGDDDVREAGDYAEITYLDGSVIQIQTADNIWQTISKDCKLELADDMVIDLSMKNIQDASGLILIDFSRIVVDSNNNVELTPMSDAMESIAENTIPHFTVNSSAGEAGASGTNGAAGTAGEIGQDGNPGNPGVEGVSGESESLSGEVLNFPVFTINEWKVTSSGCSGNITIKDEADMLLANTGDLYGEIYLLDNSTGEQISPIEPSSKTFDWYSVRESTTSFSFSNLNSDHSYMLYVSAPLQVDGDSEAYTRGFISKTFWTDSMGVYMEKYMNSTNSLQFIVNKTNASINNIRIYYKVTTTLNLNTSNSPNLNNSNGSVNINNTNLNKAGNDGYTEVIFASGQKTAIVTIDTLNPNTTYSVQLAYDLDTDKAGYEDYSNQVLELTTLKKLATISAPSLIANRNAYGFDISPGAINDEYGGIVSYKYEFYNVNKFEDDLVTLKAEKTPDKTVVGDVNTGITVSLDGTELVGGVAYKVRAIASFFNNETYIQITSAFSNEAQMNASQLPYVYFTQRKGSGSDWQEQLASGNYTTSKYYDTICGTLHISPGADGSKLMLDQDHIPTVIIRTMDAEGHYYQSEYSILSSAPAGTFEGKYLIGSNNNGDVSVDFNMINITNNIYGSKAYALKEDTDYEIIVKGDLTDDGENVTDPQFTVGKCVVHTAKNVPLTTVANYDKDTLEPVDDLNQARFAILPLKTNATADEKESYNRQLQTIDYIKIAFYKNNCIDEIKEKKQNNTFDYNTYNVKNRPFELELTRQDKLKYVYEDITYSVVKYTDTDMNAYKDGIEAIEYEVNSNVFVYIPAAYGEPTYEMNLTNAIKDKNGNVVYKSTIDTPGTKGNKSYTYMSIIDALFDCKTEKDSNTNEIKLTGGGLLFNKQLLGDKKYKTLTDMKDSCEGYTIYIAEIADYTQKNNTNIRNNEPQYDVKSQVANKLYTNTFTLSDDSEFVQYIVFIKGISNIVTGNAFGNGDNNSLARKTNNNFVDYYYELQATFDNTSKIVDSVTYYVYDAVDFYNTYYDGEPNNDKNATSGLKMNRDIMDYIQSGDNAKAGTAENLKSVLLNKTYKPADSSTTYDKIYYSPVLIDGRELGKVTVEIPATEAKSALPKVLFYPYTKEQYKSRNGVAAPTSNSNNKVLYFNDSYTDISPYGHQYVFCWTANYHVNGEDKTYHYCYPFDAKVKDGNTNELTPYYVYTSTPNATYNLKTGNENGIFNANGHTYGYGAYMLLPHSTVIDVPKIEASAHSLQWKSDEDSITMRSYIYDYYRTIYLDADGKGQVMKLKSISGSNVYSNLTNSAMIQPNYYYTSNTTNIVGALTSSTSPKSNNIYTFKSSDNITHYSSEIKIDRSDVYSTTVNDAVLVVPIQRYSDKYTIKQTNIHDSTVLNNGYINTESAKSGSIVTIYKKGSNTEVLYKFDNGSNWNFGTSVSETSNKSLYQTLLVASFDTMTGDSPQYVDYAKKFSNGDSQSNVSFSFVPVMGTGDEATKIVSYKVTLKGPTEEIKNAVGARITFTKYNYTEVEAPTGSPTENDYREKYNSYKLTTDKEVIDGKEYYTYDTDNETYVLVETPDENPQTAGYYEIVSSVYKKSNDTSVTGDKVYYQLGTIDHETSIDKFLVYNSAFGDLDSNDLSKGKEDASSNLTYSFMINCDADLGNPIQNGESNGFNFDSLKAFSGEYDIIVSGKLLYETANAGYGYLKSSTSSNKSNYRSENKDTFALKQYSYRKTSSNGLDYYVRNDDSTKYYAFTSDISKLSLPSESNYYKYDDKNGNVNGLKKFGSFFQMYTYLSNSGASLKVRSTRSWQSEASQGLAIDASIYNTTPYLPVVLTTGGYAKINIAKDYTGQTWNNYEAKGIIDLPVSNLSIKYTNAAIDSNEVGVEYSILGADYNEKYYFSITEGSNVNAGETQKFVLFEKTGAGEYTILKSTKEDSSEIAEGSEFLEISGGISSSIIGEETGVDLFAKFKENNANLMKCLIEIDSNSTNIKFCGLENEKNYTITCWKFDVSSSTDSGLQYGMVKLKMIDPNNASSKTVNIYSFKTDKLPEPSVASSGYTNNTYTQKYVSYKEGALPDGCYYVLKLFKESYTNSGVYEYATTLDVGITASVMSIDLLKENSGLDNGYGHAYKSSVVSLTHDGNAPKLNVSNSNEKYEFIYGASYRFAYDAYKIGEGPCFVTDYDNELDLDNIYKSFSYIGKTGTGADAKPTYKKYKDNTSKSNYGFTVNNTADIAKGITATSQLGNGTDSYGVFTVNSVDHKSNSTCYDVFAPLLILEHNDYDEEGNVTNTTYTNVTDKVVNSDATSSINGASVYSLPSTLKIKTATYNSETTVYENVYEEGDIIHAFAYAMTDDIDYLIDSTTHEITESHIVTARKSTDVDEYSEIMPTIGTLNETVVNDLKLGANADILKDTNIKYLGYNSVTIKSSNPSIGSVDATLLEATGDLEEILKDKSIITLTVNNVSNAALIKNIIYSLEFYGAKYASATDGNFTSIYKANPSVTRTIDISENRTLNINITDAMQAALNDCKTNGELVGASGINKIMMTVQFTLEDGETVSKIGGKVSKTLEITVGNE